MAVLHISDHWCQRCSLVSAQPWRDNHLWLWYLHGRRSNPTSWDWSATSFPTHIYYSYYYLHLLKWFNFIRGVIRLTDYPATHSEPAFALVGQTDGGRRDRAKVSPPQWDREARQMKRESEDKIKGSAVVEWYTCEKQMNTADCLLSPWKVQSGRKDEGGSLNSPPATTLANCSQTSRDTILFVSFKSFWKR